MKKNERFVAYGGCYGLLLLAAFLLQLKWQGYICCSIVFVLVMWRMDKVLKEEKKQQTRLQQIYPCHLSCKKNAASSNNP